MTTRELKLINRPTATADTFVRTGTFEALYAAQRWCDDNGYSYGSLCGYEPVGLLKGDYNIAKWKNLTYKEKQQLNGVMTGDFRNGPVTIKIFLTPTASAQ